MKRVLTFMLPVAAVIALLFPVMLQAASLEPIDSAGVQVQQQHRMASAIWPEGSVRMRRGPFNKPPVTTCT